MPISETVLAIRPQEVGKLKLGGLAAAKRTSQGGREWQAPVKFEHFVLTKTVRDKTDNNFVVNAVLMQQLAAQGCKVAELVDSSGNPKKSAVPALVEIPIILGSGLVNEVFPHSLASYLGKALYCRNSDGGDDATRFEIVDGRQTGRSKKRPCTCEYLTNPTKQGPVCKPHGTLWFSIRGGAGTRIGGRHSFRTTSWNSIRAIVSGLREIHEQVGSFYRIPLWLTYTLHETRRRDGTPTTVQVVGIECRCEDLLALQRDMIAEARSRNEVVQLYSGNPIRLGLPAPAGDAESPQEQARVAQEFHPAGDVGGGFIDVEITEGSDDDSIEFDPETGEVLERAPATTATASPDESQSESKAASQRRTEPAVPAQGTQDTAQGTQAASTGDEFLDDAAMTDKIKALLKELALARGFDPMNETEFLGACKEVLKNVTLDYVGEERTFKMLRRKDARFVIEGLAREIEQIAARDHEDGPGPEDPPA